MVTERASEMAKLIGCLQPAEPSKHPKNGDENVGQEEENEEQEEEHQEQGFIKNN